MRSKKTFESLLISFVKSITHDSLGLKLNNYPEIKYVYDKKVNEEESEVNFILKLIKDGDLFFVSKFRYDLVVFCDENINELEEQFFSYVIDSVFKNSFNNYIDKTNNHE